MEDLTINVTCPKCNQTLVIKVRDMVPGNTMQCSCGCTISFSGDDGRQVQEALDDLDQQLKNLGGGLTLKL